MFGKCSYNIIHRCVKKKTKLIVHTDKEIFHQNKKKKKKSYSRDNIFHIYIRKMSQFCVFQV
jgi:hypothetical protein